MTPSELELLTQAVDGELSARDARRLRQLLQVSEKARALLAQLEADRALLLRHQPVAEPPGDLAARVMARIQRQPEPARAPAFDRRRLWVPLAVAASLFLAVGTWSLAYSIRNRDLAQNTVPPSPTLGPVARQEQLPGPGSLVARRPDEAAPRAPLSVPPPREVPPEPRPVPEIAAAPRPVPPPDFLSSPIPEAISPFETIQVRLPLLMSLSEVKEKSDTVLRELDRDPAYRLDLFARTPSRGLDSLIAAAKSSGVMVHVDAAIRSKKGPHPTAYVVYLESLTAAEIRDLLVKLGAASKREFDLLHLAPAQPADHRELKDLLGIDVGSWKRTDTNPATRPITASTGDAVARAVATGSTARVPEKPAIALPFQPTALRSRPTASRELQQFLARRDIRPSGSKSLMIVIRNP